MWMIGILALALPFTQLNAANNIHSYDFSSGENRVSAYYLADNSSEAEFPASGTMEFRPVRYSEFALDYAGNNRVLHFASAFGEDEALGQFGWSSGGIRFDGFAGYGRNTSGIRSQYSSMDPYLFHGGIDKKYDYSGFSIARKISENLKIGFAQASIVASGLEDRSVSSFSISTNRISASYTEVDRGNEKVGRVYALSTVFRGHSVGLDYLEQANGTSYQGLNYSREHRGIRYQFALQKTENPLYREKNDSRLMFSMAFSFGRTPSRLFATEPEQPEDEKETMSGGQKALIAGGIVGVGVALSSGDSDSDNQDRLESQHAAARNVLNQINPVSVDQNREYGGYIFRNPDGSYSSTQPVGGGPVSVLLPPMTTVVPAGSTTRATYHTHAAFDPRFDNENFSPTDIQTNNLFMVDGYLGTPAGAFKYYQQSTGSISTLGSIAN
jgi:hypothetical protein